MALGPTRSWFRPGTRATFRIELQATTRTTVAACVKLLDLDRVVARTEQRLRLPAGRSHRLVGLTLPATPRHGYGVLVTLTWSGGRTSATSAVEALDGWWQSPRHAAVTDFRSPRRTARSVADLVTWRVTVVQDYDWMYRHYRYRPPSGEAFVDPLGRRVSHLAVRAGVRAGHRVGIATLAYGSVYGAEREYVDRHPDERVFDDHGVPISLGETFYINDVRPGRPWRKRLMTEYRRACRVFGFDGIHMDTYGPPHSAVSADGVPIDFASIYPSLIEEGARVVAAARTGGRVLFNCVEGFPLEQVASAPAAALYLELWPPDTDHADVVRWIDLARRLGEGRAVVIAAYISTLRAEQADTVGRAGAIEAAVLLTVIIAAAGAYHHVLAEGNRLLVEGYYPEARQLRRSEVRELQASWVFTARFVHLLSDPSLRPVVPAGIELFDADGRPIPIETSPRAGSVWVRASTLPNGTAVLQLVDLLSQADDRWDAIRQRTPDRTGWRLQWPSVEAPVAMTPWGSGGQPAAIVPHPSGGWSLPRFRRWLVAVG
jgi:dextranase